MDNALFPNQKEFVYFIDLKYTENRKNLIFHRKNEKKIMLLTDDLNKNKLLIKAFKMIELKYLKIFTDT